MARPFSPIVHGASDDRPDEADTIVAAEAVAAALRRLGHDTEIVTIGLDLSPLERLAARAPHVVVNLADAIRGDGKLFGLAPMALEHLGLAFTGVGAAAARLAIDKLAAKRALAEHGLPTPALWNAAARDPQARVIVKSVAEHASLGIDAGSIVPADQAAAEIAARRARFGGAFFAEEFIDGREINVALIDDGAGRPAVLPISEIQFDDLPPDAPRIVDYDAKWRPESAAYRGTPRRFGLEEREPKLAAALADLARAAWAATGLEGYARVDIRLDRRGRPFVLEVNANPCLAPDAGFVAAAAAGGLDYDAMVARIVAAGAAGAARGRR